MAEQRHDSSSGGVTRRQALGFGVAGGALLAAGGLLAPPATAKPGPTPGAPWKFRPQGTTLDSTMLRGAPDPGGYRRIVSGAGEPHLVRDDLGARPGRTARAQRHAVLAFGQLTDMHLLDAQSPARVEFLDRYDDPDSGLAGFLPFQGAYRAQEMLTTQVAEAMVRALNAVHHAPVTGLPLAMTITTGDNVDNTQYNELRWQIDLLDGQPVRPDSGDHTKYEGVADQVAYDVRYWHPDGTPSGGATDLPRGLHGFPTVPGLLDTCRQPFGASGLSTPWLTVFGNHDGLLQGNLPGNPLVNPLATGPVKIIDLPAGTNIITLAQQLFAGDPAGLLTLFGGPARLVTPDAARRPLSRLETITEYFTSVGAPYGHGYSAWNLNTGKAYYAFDQGPVRGIVLDTVNPFGGSEGSIDTDQLAWLTAQLQAGSSRYLDESGNLVPGGGADRLFVIFSHHTIGTMDNLAGVGRIGGAQVSELLLRFPNVVLWVNGHTHRNTVTAYPRAGGAVVPGGFWEVNTAAHIDWPQQARVVELVDNRDGTLSVFGTLVDHAGPMSPGSSPTGPLALASLSRELGANDWQDVAYTATVDGRRGSLEDRNVELVIPAPFVLAS
jgi:metallophosphoesterase (TIGR03767 family)